jgi:excisionase family DNA binding protein
MITIDNTNYYTPAEISAMYSIPQVNVYFWIRTKKLEAKRIGKKILINETQVKGLLK